MAATDKHNRPVGTKGGANQLSVRDLGEESRQEAIRWSGGRVDLNIRARETEEKKEVHQRNKKLLDQLFLLLQSQNFDWTNQCPLGRKRAELQPGLSCGRNRT